MTCGPLRPNSERSCVTVSETTTEETNSEAAPSFPQTSTWLDQDDTLRELWLSNESPAMIAERLGRSVAAVMTRAARLGLPRRAAPGRKPGYQRKKNVDRDGMSALGAPTSRHAALLKSHAAAPQAMPMARICLMCLTKFPSEGRHNRICPSCKGSAEYNAGSSIPDIFKIDA